MQNIDYDLRSVQEARDLARLGQIATEKIAGYNEEQIDKIIRNMVRVAEENAVSLAQMAVEETGFGKVADKTYKNHMASTMLYDAIKDMKTIGIISEDPVARTMDVADPVGLLMGIVPSTNPTSTAIFKSIIAIKARNAIVFSPHPSAVKCTLKAATLMRDAAVEAGAPENIIGCISMPSMPATDELMHSKEVKMIIATGGPGMVKASYSAGKPALGVGAGNSPAYIERTANVQQAVTNIIASKTFDYGTICASEQSIICEECNKDAVIAELKKQGAYFMSPEETDKVCKLLFLRWNLYRHVRWIFGGNSLSVFIPEAFYCIVISFSRLCRLICVGSNIGSHRGQSLEASARLFPINTIAIGIGNFFPANQRASVSIGFGRYLRGRITENSLACRIVYCHGCAG